jgi:hypothetical protein
MQKIWVVVVFFVCLSLSLSLFPEKSFTGSWKFGCYYLQYVPASKLFDHS